MVSNVSDFELNFMKNQLMNQSLKDQLLLKSDLMERREANQVLAMQLQLRGNEK